MAETGRLSQHQAALKRRRSAVHHRRRKRSCSGLSSPTGSGGRRRVALTLVIDRQGEARSILRLSAGCGSGRQKGGRYVVGRVWIARHGNGIEAVRSGGGDAETGRR